jgi:hypothetical protein
MQTIRICKRAVLAAALSTAFAVPALAAGDAHDHGAATSVALQLDHGKKWQTDEPLRKGMTSVRTAVATDLKVVHANKATTRQYEALAAKVNAEVAGIVQNCKLPPEADAQLHIVVAELIAGAEAMEGKEKGVARRDGAVRVIKALNAYGEYFDHAGWNRL